MKWNSVKDLGENLAPGAVKKYQYFVGKLEGIDKSCIELHTCKSTGGEELWSGGSHDIYMCKRITLNHLNAENLPKPGRKQKIKKLPSHLLLSRESREKSVP